MRYYLFVIRKEYYRKNDNYLYTMLENLKFMNKENYNYGFSIYHSMCYFFNDSIIKNYLDKKYNLTPVNNTYYFKDDTTLKINKSYAVINTKRHLRELLCIFYIYHKDIFVCNFDTKEYFWLRDKITYNYS